MDGGVLMVLHRVNNFPYPPMLSRERLRVRVRLISDPEWSRKSIASDLNAVYAHYNRGCRSPAGIADLIRRKGMRMTQA